MRKFLALPAILVAMLCAAGSKRLQPNGTDRRRGHVAVDRPRGAMPSRATCPESSSSQAQRR